MTVLKYLQRLKARKIIDYRRVGPAKVWFLAKNEEPEKNFAQLKPKVYNILREFEELTGSKANLTFEKKRLTLTAKLAPAAE